MPIHDWTRVDDTIWHHFHLLWIGDIGRILNSGVLPDGYYALAEPVSTQPNASRREPDVLTLSAADPSEGFGQSATNGDGGGNAVLTTPATRFHMAVNAVGPRRRRVTIRHESDDRVVAAIELLSRGKKSSQAKLAQLLDKAQSFLAAGVHLLLIDLFPPTTRDPEGIHGMLWQRLAERAEAESNACQPDGDPTEFHLPAETPLTLAAYRAWDGGGCEAFIEPVAVGGELPAMPVFLREGHVLLPLAGTYQAAFRGVPLRDKRVLEAAADSQP